MIACSLPFSNTHLLSQCQSRSHASTPRLLGNSLLTPAHSPHCLPLIVRLSHTSAPLTFRCSMHRSTTRLLHLTASAINWHSRETIPVTPSFPLRTCSPLSIFLFLLPLDSLLQAWGGVTPQMTHHQSGRSRGRPYSSHRPGLASLPLVSVTSACAEY